MKEEAMLIRLAGDFRQAFVIEINADSPEEAVSRLNSMSPRDIMLDADMGRSEVDDDTILIVDVLGDK